MICSLVYPACSLPALNSPSEINKISAAGYKTVREIVET